MTAPVIVTDADTLRQIVRDELTALFAQQQPTPATETGQAYYTVTEAAEYLRIDPSTIYQAAARGEINKTPIGRGREYRISREALNAYARRLEGAA